MGQDRGARSREQDRGTRLRLMGSDWLQLIGLVWLVVCSLYFPLLFVFRGRYGVEEGNKH